jgi:hypothetical protein
MTSQVLASIRVLHRALMGAPPYLPPPAAAPLATQLTHLQTASVSHHVGGALLQGASGASGGPLTLDSGDHGGVTSSLPGIAVGAPGAGGGPRSASGSATPVAAALRGATLTGHGSGGATGSSRLGAPPPPPGLSALGGPGSQHLRRNSHTSVSSSQDGAAAAAGDVGTSGLWGDLLMVSACIG